MYCETNFNIFVTAASLKNWDQCKWFAGWVSERSFRIFYLTYSSRTAITYCILYNAASLNIKENRPTHVEQQKIYSNSNSKSIDYSSSSISGNSCLIGRTRVALFLDRWLECVDSRWHNNHLFIILHSLLLTLMNLLNICTLVYC
jgi:hypothetical protein